MGDVRCGREGTRMETDKRRRTVLAQGMRDGVPIALGYFAVSFALGIAARNAGLSPLQGFIASLLCNASAGEYAGFTVIAARSGLLTMAVMTLVANARYLLMSTAMSQRMDPEGNPIHRFLMSIYITDELFAITIARPGYLEPFYLYGAALVASPAWALGTALGCLAGEMLPQQVVSALSVALFGMFLAVIVPPARKNKVIAGLIPVCFTASFAMSRLPLVSNLPEGTRTIILTVVIASAAALLFPHVEEPKEVGS